AADAFPSSSRRVVVRERSTRQGTEDARMPLRNTLLAALALLAPASTDVGVGCPAELARYCEEIARLREDAAVRRALAHVEAADAEALRDLITLTAIPAPPFGEEARARKYAAMLREAGADSVWIDEVGNVIALRRGRTGGGCSRSPGTSTRSSRRGRTSRCG